MFDKTDVNGWREIARSDHSSGHTAVTLTDEQTLKDLMDDDVEGAFSGLELKVVNSEVNTTIDGSVEWLLFELEGYKISLWLLIKIIKGGTEPDFRIYFEPEDFLPGNREELLERECQWLFNEPKDPDDFSPSSLDHASKIQNEDPDSGKKNIFRAKSGTSYGESGERGRDDVFLQVTEYLADNNCDNPECITLEYGGLDDDDESLEEGGYIVFKQGAKIGTESFDVLTTIAV